MAAPVKFAGMVGAGWMDKPSTVTLARSRALDAPPEVVWELVSRPDAALLLEGPAMVVPVPGTALSCVLEVSTLGGYVRVREQLPAEAPWTLRTVDRTTGITITVRLEKRRSGSRVQLEQVIEVPRHAVRQYTANFELVAAPWLDAVATIATGFREFPAQRPDLVLAAAGRLGPETASLVGSRTVPAPPAATWASVLHRPDVLGFSTPDGPLAAGHWQYRIHTTDRVRATVHQVTACAATERLTLRSLAGDHHLAITDWILEDVPGGTRVTLSHSCATSHVGLPPMVDLALDALQERLTER
jgi:hypothetical protein